MTPTLPKLIAALGLTVAILGACSRGPRVVSGADIQAPSATRANPAPANATNAVGRYPFTKADVDFMSGMVPHHAQAVLIAGWAATHDAGASLKVLAERIVVAQSDEIALMRTWLRERNQPVPDSNATHLHMKMDGVEHDMLMPGMLNAEELAQLDKARGTAFDRLFLQFMIRHHEGALSMVEKLLGSPGAAQDEIVYKFASDVFADQSTEIDRMQKMLAAISPDARRP
jgi:uncharacterized protein (DUF305 family)